MVVRQGSQARAVAPFLGFILLSTGVTVGRDRPGEDSGEAAGASPPSQGGELPGPPSSSAALKRFDLRTARNLTGDWGGSRTWLAGHGISFKPVYMQQFQQNLRGGLETKNGHDLFGSFDLNLELDFGKMNLVPGGSFFIRGKSTWRDGINPEKVGALFNVNNDADGDHAAWVDKWWWRQRWLDDRIEVYLGRLDTKGWPFFDGNAYASSEDKHFLNKAFTRTMTVPHSKGLGVMLRVWPADWLYFSGATLDARARKRRTGFDTAFHGPARFRAFFEFGLLPRWETPKGVLPGHYRAGLWYEPKPKEVFFDDLGGRRADRFRGDDVGFYLVCDQLVWKENDDPKDKQGLGLFARYGFGHRDVNKVTHFWSVGAQYEGLIPTRDRDVLGLAVAQGILSSQFRDEVHPGADRETVYELYYAYHAAPWLIISPDIQVVTNPGGDKDDRDAVVAGVRVKITF